MPLSRMKAKRMTGKKFSLAIHGGAGTIAPEQITPAIERELRAGLQQSLDAGRAILQNGGSSLDAVVAAVRVLEDDPLFNAGRGAVFTSAGTNETDAAIMDGRTLMAGAGGAVAQLQNPIVHVRGVMDKSPHPILPAKNQETFASELVRIKPDGKFLLHKRLRGGLK